MTNKPFYSISDVFQEMTRLNNNSLKILSGVVSSFTTDQDKINVIIKDTKGIDQLYTIPSYSFLRKQMNTASNNVTNLYNIYTQNKFLPTIGQESTSEPKEIGSLSNSGIFYTEANSFARYLFSKKLFVEIDLTNKIDSHSKFVLCKRIFIDEDPKIQNSTLEDVWANFSDKANNLNYDDVKTILTQNKDKISFDEEESIEIVQPSELKYSGEFAIIKIFPDIISDTTYSSSRKYSLSTIYYDDLTINRTKTASLKQDDVLISLDGLNQFSVRNVEIIASTTGDSTNEYYVTLAQISGSTNINETDTLKILSDVNNNQKIKIPVGPYERTILFLKPIDPYFHTTTKNWSPGLLIKEDDLNIILDNGTKENILDFYKQIDSYSEVLTGSAKEQTTPAYLGDIPDAPTLDQRNFQVVKINDQRTTTTSNDDIQKLIASRNELLDQETTIQNKIQTLADAFKNHIIDYDTYQAQLTQYNQLLAEVQAKRMQYDIQIANSVNTNSINIIDPKYQLRGFWNIPLAKKDSKGISQEIIQFKIQYRYLDMNGNQLDSTSMPYIDTDGKTKPAIFSNWIQAESILRQRIFDDTTKTYTWQSQNTDNASEININQIGIPINPNEQIELQIASISSSGWPSNPLMSVFSNSVIIPFPTELQQSDVVNNTISSVLNEEKFKSDLQQLNDTITRLSVRINTLQVQMQSTADYYEILTVVKPPDSIPPLIVSLSYIPLTNYPIMLLDLDSKKLLIAGVDYTLSGQNNIYLLQPYLDLLTPSQSYQVWTIYKRSINTAIQV